MVSLKTVQASNAGIRALPKITALFVGGTSGIGQSTLRQLARQADSPTAYIIGRNKARASPFLSELRQLSPKGRFHFIEADVSLVRNVDAACRQILQQEKQLNFLFMTPGGISMGGRNETVEGIDYLFALRYYSRRDLGGVTTESGAGEIRNTNITQIQKAFTDNGLGSVSDVMACIFPALKIQGKLPQDIAGVDIGRPAQPTAGMMYSMAAQQSLA